MDTGEVYDDQNPFVLNGAGLSVPDYLTFIASRDGWVYQALPA
jgi:hypothetical protein